MLIKDCRNKKKNPLDLKKDISDLNAKIDSFYEYDVSKDTFIELKKDIQESNLIISHNIENDINSIIRNGYHKYGININFDEKVNFCTMKDERIVKFCQGFEEYVTKEWPKFKEWPKLEELHQFLFAEDKIQKHDSLSDVIMCEQCFFELKKRGIIE